MKWQKVLLGNLVDEGSLDILTGPFGTQLKASDYTKIGTPVINVRNIGYGDLKPEKLEYVPEPVVQKLERHILQKGDIVFARKGAVDRHLLVEESQSGWMQGSDCIRIRLSSRKVSHKFLSYSLRLESHKSWILNQCGNKATMASLNQDVIRRVIVRLPNIDIQQEIVNILSKYDDLIENNRRRIQLLERSLHLLYKEWFVHLRFPSHEHSKIVDGIPEGWERDKVENIITTFKQSKKIKNSDYLKHGSIPCVDQSQDFIGGYTDDIEAVIDIGKPVIVFGDHTRVLKFIDFPFARGADGTQLIISKRDNLSQEFLYFSLEAINLSNYFYARHFKFLKDQFILIPSSLLIKQFTETAFPAMRQIKVLREQNRQLSQARDLLLPKLMSGAISV
jgi:type I restriction enzyme S subunit